MTLPPDAAAVYTRMQGRFQQRMRADSQTLRDEMELLRKDDATWSGHDRLRNLAHQLAGLGGTFGFDAVSEASMHLEDTLMVPAGRSDRHAIEAAIRKLLRVLAQACDTRQS